MKILFDTNIILDALQGREPWREDAEKLFMAVANEKIEGFVTAKELCDIWYLAKNIHKGEDNAYRKAQKYVSDLCKIFYVLDTTADDINRALSLEYKDFEDAVMLSTAERMGIEGIVTRNIKDFPLPFSSYSLWTPEELVKNIGL